MTPEEKQKLAEANAHIPTETIQQDIIDTTREIEKYQAELPHLQALAQTGNRMMDIVATNRQHQIEERQQFIEKLRIILEVRGIS